MQASSEALKAKCLLAFFRCMHINQNIRALHTQNDSYSQLFSTKQSIRL